MPPPTTTTTGPPTHHIPAIYRIFFTWVDPIISLHTAYQAFADPAWLLNAFVPTTFAPRVPAHDVMFQQLGGAFVVFAIGFGVLLRYTQDINVWRIWVGGIFIEDLVLLYSQYSALRFQGRLDPATWRAEDWGCWAVGGGITLLRLAFLLGWGVREQKRAVARKD